MFHQIKSLKIKANVSRKQIFWNHVLNWMAKSTPVTNKKAIERF